MTGEMRTELSISEAAFLMESTERDIRAALRTGVLQPIACGRRRMVGRDSLRAALQGRLLALLLLDRLATGTLRLPEHRSGITLLDAVVELVDEFAPPSRQRGTGALKAGGA